MGLYHFKVPVIKTASCFKWENRGVVDECRRQNSRSSNSHLRQAPSYCLTSVKAFKGWFTLILDER